jgi:hypothetical protein
MVSKSKRPKESWATWVVMALPSQSARTVARKSRSRCARHDGPFPRPADSLHQRSLLPRWMLPRPCTQPSCLHGCPVCAAPSGSWGGLALSQGPWLAPSRLRDCLACAGRLVADEGPAWQSTAHQRRTPQSLCSASCPGAKASIGLTPACFRFRFRSLLSCTTGATFLPQSTRFLQRVACHVKSVQTEIASANPKASLSPGKTMPRYWFTSLTWHGKPRRACSVPISVSWRSMRH